RVQLVPPVQLGQGLLKQLLHLQLLVFRQLAVRQGGQGRVDGFAGGRFGGVKKGGQAEQKQEQRANQRHDVTAPVGGRGGPGRPTRWRRGGLGLEGRPQRHALAFGEFQA